MLNEETFMRQEFEFKRGAIKPVQCLSDACVMLKGCYGSFLGVMMIAFLIILISSCLPFMPLLPPIICGIYLCMFAAMERQPFNTGTLFKGFDFFGQSFLAFLVLSIPLGILSGILQIGLTALEKADNPKATPEEDLQSILYGLGFIFGMLFLIYAASLVIGMLTAFVYPLIVDRKMKAWAALKLSFRAVMGNFFGVIGLMFLGQLLMFAGLWLCYIGALFVAPVVFAAWTIAYRRIFPLRVLPASPTNLGGMVQQQNLRIPPVTASKAGWILTLGSIVIVALGTFGTFALGSFVYQLVLTGIEIEKAEKEKKKLEKQNEEIETKTEEPEPTEQPETNPKPQPPTNPPTVKVVSGGVLNGKAIDLPKPVYPAAARAVKASGAVNVQVTVDENGNVLSASAVSGHPLLRASAVAAAKNAKFKPTNLSGQPVKVKGVIVYNFVP